MAERLKMLPSEFRSSANYQDVIEMLAWDRTKDKDWRKRQEVEAQIKRSKEMSDEQKAKMLFGGF